MSRKDWSDEKLFFKLQNNKTENAKWNAIREIRRRPTTENFYRCVELAKSDNALERELAVSILSQFGLPPRPFINETIALFFEILKTENNHNVIGTIFSGLGHNNENLNNEQIEYICSFKNARNIYVLNSLVFGLVGVQNDTAIDTLIGFSKHKNKNIRDWATFGLGSGLFVDNEKIRDALWDRVNDNYINARQEAILGLALKKDSRIKNILIHEIQDLNNLTSLFFEAIEALNDVDFIELLESTLKRENINEFVNSQWLENSIEKIRNTKV